MIICIEYWKGDTHLSGKRISRSKLMEQMCTVEKLCDPHEDNFIPLLCRMYGWERLKFSADDVPAYTYDRDTSLIL